MEYNMSKDIYLSVSLFLLCTYDTLQILHIIMLFPTRKYKNNKKNIRKMFCGAKKTYTQTNNNKAL